MSVLTCCSDIPTLYQNDTQVGFTTEISIWSPLGEVGSDIGDLDELVFTDDEELDQIWDCSNPDLYADLDGIISDNDIPVVCHNYYILSVMARNLTASLATYNDLMADGYEEKYSYYALAVRATAPLNWDKFYDKEYDDLVTCTWYHPQNSGSETYVNITDGCPPNDTPSYAKGSAEPSILYTAVDNKTAFFEVIENTYGMQPDWINFDAYTVQQQYCQTVAPVGSGAPIACPEGAAPSWFQPALYSSLTVDDPANSVSKALENYQGISDWLNAIVREVSVGLYLGSHANVVDAVDTVVYTVDAAVTSMQQVYDIGSKVEEEIEEEERKNIILFFITSILLLLPGLGEELDAIIDVSIYARTATMIGNVGDAALTIYGVYEDPSSAPLAIAGLLLGGVATREDSVLSDAAKIRRGMSDEKITALGTKTESNLNKVAKLRARCDI